MSQIAKFKVVALTFSSNGDNNAIAAVTGRPILLWKVFFTVAGAVNVTFKDGASTSLSGAYQLTGAGSSLLLYYDGSPHYISSPGNALVMNLSSGVAVAGSAWYTEG